MGLTLISQFTPKINIGPDRSHVRAHMCVRLENKQTIMKQKEKKRERMDTEFT